MEKNYDLNGMGFYFFFYNLILQPVGKKDLNHNSPHKGDQSIPLSYKAPGTTGF